MRVRFNTGMWAIEKRFRDDQPKESSDREVLASLVGRILPAPVPVVIQTDVREIYMELMPGKTALEILLNRLLTIPQTATPSDERKQQLLGIEEEFKAGLAKTKTGLAVAVFDAVINNTDRNLQNLLIDRAPRGHGHQITGAIDNAGISNSTDPSSGVSGNFRPGPGATKSVFARHWLLVSQPGSPYWKNNVLHPADVDTWLSGINAIQGEFRSRGLPEWWEAVSGRLYAIGLHATGRTRWRNLSIPRHVPYPVASPHRAPAREPNVATQQSEIRTPPISPGM